MFENIKIGVLNNLVFGELAQLSVRVHEVADSILSFFSMQKVDLIYQLRERYTEDNIISHMEALCSICVQYTVKSQSNFYTLPTEKYIPLLFHQSPRSTQPETYSHIKALLLNPTYKHT